MEAILEKLGDIGVNAGIKLLYAIFILFIGTKLINLLIKIVKKSVIFNKMDQGIATFLLSFIRITLYVVLFITFASLLGVPLTSMLTILGSAGVAIGLALQGGLSNIAGGIIILLFKPFVVGDFIDTHADSGTVTGISLFYTTLKTPDNKIISIPNGNLANEATVNYSREDKRRLDINIDVSYKNDVQLVKKVLMDLVNQDSRIIKDKDIFIGITSYKDSSVCYTIRIWVKNSEYWSVQYDLLEQIKYAFEENNIEIPYPKMDIHIEK